jgi:hypothetical protein
MGPGVEEHVVTTVFFFGLPASAYVGSELE